jgi:hypothetical protein
MLDSHKNEKKTFMLASIEDTIISSIYTYTKTAKPGSSAYADPDSDHAIFISDLQNANKKLI